jgi:hypothetical protein
MALGLRRLFIALLFAAAAWLVAANGVAAQLVGAGSPSLAATIAPDADRLSRHAQALFFERDYAAAAAAARRALALSPLQVRAARVLGQSELALGHEEAGLAAMEVAGQGGWRDNVTQLWIMQAALGGGDYDEALQRADALIRRAALTDRLFADLRPWFAEPAFRAALVKRLGDGPDWRAQLFLDWRKAAPGEVPGIVQLIADIDRSAAPVTDLELFPLTERLLELGAIGPAHALWLARAPRAGWAPGNLVYDGRFAVARSRQYGERPPRFEWWVDPAQTSLASVDVAADGRGGSLRIASNAGDPVELARETLMLAPGRYRLLARIAAQTGRDVAGLDFALRCYPRDADLPLEDRRVAQAGIGQLRYQGAATVAAGCVRQDLIVRIAGGEPVGGDVAIAEVAVVPQR